MIHIDHTHYPTTLRTKSDAELYYIVRDAGEAMKAMPTGEKAGYYADEIHYAYAELTRRRKEPHHARSLHL